MIKLTTAAEEKTVIAEFHKGVRNDRFEDQKRDAVKALEMYLPTTGIMNALAEFVRDATDNEFSAVHAALSYLSNYMFFKVAKEAVELTAVSHPFWTIQSTAQKIICRCDYAAMIAACE